MCLRRTLPCRLGEPGDAFAPSMLAAAAGGVIQAAHTRWTLHGGDLSATISESLEILERGIGPRVSEGDRRAT